MSDIKVDEIVAEIAEVAENSNPTPQDVKEKKPKKKRAPMSEEHKAKCRESLIKAREASKKKRQKNAYVKKIKKKEEEKAKDDQIKKTILNDDKDKEIAMLKKKLESLTLQDVVQKPEPKPKQQEPLPTIDEVDEAPTPLKDEPPKPPKKVEMKIEEVEPPVKPIPVENVNKTHTITREKTSQMVKPKRRKPKRLKGMAKYGRC